MWCRDEPPVWCLLLLAWATAIVFVFVSSSVIFGSDCTIERLQFTIYIISCSSFIKYLECVTVLWATVEAETTFI